MKLSFGKADDNYIRSPLMMSLMDGDGDGASASSNNDDSSSSPLGGGAGALNRGLLLLDAEQQQAENATAEHDLDASSFDWNVRRSIVKQESIRSAGEHILPGKCTKRSSTCSSGHPVIRNFPGAEEEYVRAKKMSDKVPCFFRHSIPEATGFNLFTVGQACLVASLFLFSSTLLDIAKEVASCEDDAVDEDVDEGESSSIVDDVFRVSSSECIPKLWGLVRPTSLMSVIGTFISLGSALILPFVGAIIDHTPYRKQVGICTSSVVIMLNMVQIAISVETFPIMLITFVLLGYLLAVHFCVGEAYLPDLNMDDKGMGTFASNFNMIFFTTIFMFQILVYCVTEHLDLDDIASCRVSQIALVICLILFWAYPWRYLFTSRPSLHKVPEGRSLFTTGFVSAWHTAVDIYRNFHDLGVFILSLMFLNGALGSLISISTTFLTEMMLLSNKEIMFVFFIVCFSAVPGAYASTIFIQLCGPLQSYRLCVAMWMVTIIVGAIVLGENTDWYHTCTFAAIWGFGYGFKDPIDMAIYTTIIPRGREAEMMSINALSAGVLVWAPNFTFTTLNELDIPMSYCLSSLSGYFLISFLISLKLDDYERAVAHAAQFGTERTSADSSESEEEEESVYSEVDDDTSMSARVDKDGYELITNTIDTSLFCKIREI